MLCIAQKANAEQEIVRRKEKLLLEIGETGKEADFWPGKNFDGLKQALVEKLSQIRMRAVTQTSDEKEWRVKAEESRREAEA